jgi:hypothetical protein
MVIKIFMNGFGSVEKVKVDVIEQEVFATTMLCWGFWET